MTREDRAPLRVALLHHAPAPACVGDLERALRAAGHAPQVVAARTVAPAELLLRARGFTRPLSHLPAAGVALARGRFDLAHAFSVPDAAAALAWGGRAGRPVVFTSVEALDRDRVADGRLRLRLLESVLREADAVTAATEPARAALARWLLVDAPLMHARDAAAHEALYRDLLSRRTAG